MANFQKIIVNGKEVDSANLQNLPESVQQVLADKNANGIPDFMDGILEHPMVKGALEKGGYTSFNQIPPEMREKLQGLMQKLGGTGLSGGPQVHVGSVQVNPQESSGSNHPGQFAPRQAEWQQGISQQQPGMVSVKTVIFATAVILGLLIFAFIAGMAFFGKSI